MEPSRFLELLRAPDASAPLSRAYAALTRSATSETFVTFHKDGQFQAYPYTSLLLIGGDARGGTAISINHAKWRIVIEGRQLAPVFEALRTRTAAHLFEWSGGAHDLPRPGAPIITRIAFGKEPPRREAATSA